MSGERHKNRLRDPDHAPFRVWLPPMGYTCHLSVKFEVSISTGYKDMKGDTECRKWGGFLIVWSHSRSLANRSMW